MGLMNVPSFTDSLYIYFI
uniref:Uncharacterized protein n=1 Tax=Anguilla anguilla TaxID=7936 RepID=A0A0E9TW68_ANGAN